MIRRRDKRGSLRGAATDPKAFGAFYDVHVDEILRFFARKVLDPETALDMTAETFARALERCAQYRGETVEEERGWLFAIARNHLNTSWERQRVAREALERLEIRTPKLSDADFDRIEELASIQPLVPAIRAALDALPDDQRRAVELRVVEQLGYEEVAAALEVSQATARARVSRGLRALAAIVAHPSEVEEAA